MVTLCLTFRGNTKLKKYILFKNKYLFIYLAGALGCGLWDLIPQLGIRPRLPAES